MNTFLNWSFGGYEDGELTIGLLTNRQDLLDLPPKEMSVEEFKQEIQELNVEVI